MYLDTTFCSKEYENFPLRDHAYEAIWELVNSWIRKNGMYVVCKAIEVGVILLIDPANGSCNVHKKSKYQNLAHLKDFEPLPGAA